MNKRYQGLRRDDNAGIQYSFVLIIAFVMILGFLVSGVSKFAQSGDMSETDYSDIQAPFGFYNYTTIAGEPTDDRYVDFGDEEGYLVSTDDVVDYVPYPTDDDPFLFYDPDDGDTKYVHVVRNNRDYDPESTDIYEMYLDFIVVRRDPHNFFKISDEWHNAVIPFSSMVDNYVNKTNVSVNDFQLGDSQDTLFANSTNPGLSNFTVALYSNNFYLYYGWSKFRLEEVDFWNAISMVLYQDIPGIHPVINWMLHGFVLGVVIFVVWRMAVMMTPFLG